ncbi:MAG: pimeloyl-CoA dehydrogenase small subunit [Variovorax sp.]|nr:pimeloyl-CoA dehydrogenase small subunit [Variovorax sp.]
MNFELNDDQRMLQDSARNWLSKEYGHAAWRQIANSPQGFSTHAWAQFAEMGWLAASLPAEHDGLGGGAIENMVLGDAFGAALVLEPFMSTVVVGAGLIAEAGSREQAADYLPRIAAGRLRTAVAFAEKGARFTLHDVQTKAERRAGGWVLDGEKITVWDAPGADIVIVLARTAGARTDAQGLGLFVVKSDAAGLRREAYPMIDYRAGAHLKFDSVKADAVLGDAEAALGTVQHIVDRAMAYLAAEATGAMRAATALSIDYLQQRKQFGQPLSTFQVLRHRVVDMNIQVECMQSLAMHAALMASDTADKNGLAIAAAAAKVQAGRAGREVGQAAVQLHGGMGMTNELAVGQYLKRLVMIDMAFGNADHHQARFAGLSFAPVA